MPISDNIFAKIKKLQNISLKWKLLIPFLFFAFAGTTTLATIGLTSQQNLIKKEERKEIIHYYHHFLARLDQKKAQSISMASVVAENPEVQRLLSERNKEGLIELLMPTYTRLQRDFEISQFHFHAPVAVSFLRLHRPEQSGEEMEFFRKTIVNAIKTGQAVSGLEKGITGFGIRGVVPVKLQGRIVGSFEIGQTFGKPFLNNFYKYWDIDTALYEIHENGRYQMIAWAGKIPKEVFAGPSQVRGILQQAVIRIAPEKFPDRSILFGPIKDYSGRVVAAVEINLDRSEIMAKLTRIRNLMVSIGMAGIAVSFILTYLVAILFIRPIKEIVKEAQDIALEKRESRLEERPNDEIGTLTDALNTMLEALLKRRTEVENYAKTLEQRVQERTSELLASEEKYRALVENVPLIVYRVHKDGTTAFVNSYLTESLGYTIEEAVSDEGFWRRNICGSELDANKDVFQTCFLNGEEYRIERVVKDKEGRLLTFIDHAIPNRKGQGEVEWIDGIMMDITELKRLQERAVRTEEIKTLGEISARIAHEIRNPLSAAGGFARRLHNALTDSDPQKKMSKIIVDEIAKLETILQILLSSIRPFDLDLTEVDLNVLLTEWLKGVEGQLRVKHVKLVKEFSPGIPRIQADGERLSQAFKSILKHAILSVPEGEAIFLSTKHENDHLTVTLKHQVDRLTEDDLEKFFFPHIEDKTESTIVDLPLSKIIIHRHGGKVEVTREKENVLVMAIEFPVKMTEEVAI